MILKLKNIKNNIPAAVRKYAEENCQGRCSYVSYLEKYKDEILQRVFAYKKPKGKDLLITEVVRRLSGFDKIIIKNIYFTSLGGYQAVFNCKTVKQSYYGYYYGFNRFEEDNFDKWFSDDCDYYKVGYDIINPGLLKETKYKYCGFVNQQYLMDYLNTYIKYPNLELISKLGIKPSKTLCNKAMKDKQFCKYLNQYKNEVNKYGSAATLMAYKNRISIKDAHDTISIRREIGKSIPEVRDTDIDRVRLSRYLMENNISFSLYDDYLQAIKYVNLDLSDTKNTYPKDFMRMHDLRTQEYEAAKIKNDLEGKRNLNRKFKKVSKMYSILNLDGKYLISIAKDLTELVHEGNVLHHCVGKMGYDKKMADAKSLILFVRNKENPDEPFVTMEYSLKDKRVSQIYGDHNHRPSDDVMNFVNNIWLKFAKKQLKTIG